MKTIVTTICVLFLLFIASLFPKGYEMGKKAFNSKLHNGVYCAIYDVMEKHELTKPEKVAMSDYLSKCLIESQNAKQRQIEDFLKENKEELEKKIKKESFDLKKN